MLRLGIRVSTVASKGKGHLIRCLSIRQNLKGNFFWFIDYKDKTLEKEIFQEDEIYYENSSDQSENLKRFIINNSINSILIDSYNIIQDISGLKSLIQTKKTLIEKIIFDTRSFEPLILYIISCLSNIFS